MQDLLATCASISLGCDDSYDNDMDVIQQTSSTSPRKVVDVAGRLAPDAREADT